MFGCLRNSIGIARNSSVVYVTVSESLVTRLVLISVACIQLNKIESRETSNRKYLSKSILACRERQANNSHVIKGS